MTNNSATPEAMNGYMVIRDKKLKERQQIQNRHLAEAARIDSLLAQDKQFISEIKAELSELENQISQIVKEAPTQDFLRQIAHSRVYVGTLSSVRYTLFHTDGIGCDTGISFHLEIKTSKWYQIHLPAIWVELVADSLPGSNREVAIQDWQEPLQDRYLDCPSNTQSFVNRLRDEILPLLQNLASNPELIAQGLY